MNRHFDYLPNSIRHLPRDKRGYPVPYFAAEIDGEPNFTVADPAKFKAALKENRCWICGGHLGRLKTFVLGPMCTVTRTTSEPPCHRECAEFAVKACPFLTKPLAKRSDLEGVEHTNPGGIMITRNPGVSALWATREYEVFQANGVLIQVGEPIALSFWREGRPATRDEVFESIKSGAPALVQAAASEGPEATKELERTFYEFRVNVLDRFIPEKRNV